MFTLMLLRMRAVPPRQRNSGGIGASTPPLARLSARGKSIADRINNGCCIQLEIRKQLAKLA